MCDKKCENCENYSIKNDFTINGWAGREPHPCLNCKWNKIDNDNYEEKIDIHDWYAMNVSLPAILESI